MKRLGAWLALLAIGLHAVWPLLANAKTGAEPFYTVVCTDHGTIAVPVQDGEKKVGKPHCELCSTGCSPAADSTRSFSSPRFTSSETEAADQPFVVRFVLTPLSARAPPSLS